MSRSSSPAAARPLAVLSVALLAAAASVAPAHGNFVAGGGDPAGDATDPSPGRDIVAVGFAYDRRTGHIRGGVRLNGDPVGTPSNLTLFAGNRTASGCNGFPAVGFGTQTDLRRAAWVRLDAPGAPAAQGTAQKLFDVAIEEYEATASALAGRRPDCVIAQIDEPGNQGVVYDVAGPFPLKGLPEIEAKLGEVPAIFTAGRSRTVRVTLTNPGDAATGRVRLAVAGARGLTVKAPKRLPSLAAGARRTVRLEVTLGRRARKLTPLRLTTTAAGGIRATVEDRLYLSQRGGSSGGGSGSGPGGGVGATKLCNKYTWLPPYSTLVPC